ncbi:MAG: hypothetical protein M1505_01790 [Patescibacteria group bacterium]|nr:hypothetical protein [Patescibacteria group bacterium]
MKNKFWLAVFLIVSTIVGLGVFILPYAAGQAGLYFWFWLSLLAAAIYLLHLAYAEIIFYVGQKHNLPSLAGRLIRPSLKLPVWLSDYIGVELTALIFLVALAKFIALIIPVDPFLIKLATFVLIGLGLGFSINPLAKIEGWLTIFLIGLFIFVGIYLLSNFNLANLNFNFGQPLSSFGIILFSLTGYSSLQLVYDLIGRDARAFKKINLTALLLVFLIYVFYVLTVAGAFGPRISDDSLTSFSFYLPKLFLLGAVLLGVLNILTTFIVLVFYIERGLIADFNFQKISAWFVSVLPIYAFIFFPIEKIAGLAGFVGSFFIGLNLIVIFLIYLKLPEVKYFHLDKRLVWLLIALFGFGVIQALI